MKEKIREKTEHIDIYPIFAAQNNGCLSSSAGRAHPF